MMKPDVGTPSNLIRSLVHSRWFALLELSLALLIGWLIFARPGLQGWSLGTAAPLYPAAPLLLALLPWVARMAGGRAPFKRTRFDGRLILFMLTAGVAAWAAYDPAAGWAKFWLLVAGLLVYQALAGQPMENLRAAAGVLGGIAALISLYFLMTHNWGAAPADIGLVNRVAMVWMEVRPEIAAGWLHPNLVGGLIATYAPLLVWLFMRSVQKRRWREAVYALLAGAIAALGLLFSSSRAAWLALAVGLAAWLIWELDEALGNSGRRRWQFALRMSGALLLLLAGGLVLASGGKMIDVLGGLPGPDSTVSRLEIYNNALRLVSDMPFTGGGLAAFAGQYSEYVILIPVLLFEYAHSLYLDVAVEQGLPALGLLIVLLAGSFRLVLAPPAAQVRRPRWLRGALLAALVVMVLHGVVDDPLYGAAGTPLLFSLPGMVMAAAGQTAKKITTAPLPTGKGWGVRVWTALALVVLILTIWQRGPLLAAWYTNLGAVQMARAGLAGFPTGGWDETTDFEKYALPSLYFERALQQDPLNAGAHYRLGLLALRRRAFSEAQEHLEQALALDPGRRGATKALGYCYTWLGRLPDAARLLVSIPEAGREMEAYSGWWLQQARPDLAEKARAMMGILSVAK